MELKSGSDYATVEASKAFEEAVCVQDLETGDSVYLDRTQIKQLLPVLTSFIETGETPE